MQAFVALPIHWPERHARQRKIKDPELSSAFPNDLREPCHIPTKWTIVTSHLQRGCCRPGEIAGFAGSVHSVIARSVSVRSRYRDWLRVHLCGCLREVVTKS